jgi:8-oxo-dGTP diphosphatase
MELNWSTRKKTGANMSGESLLEPFESWLDRTKRSIPVTPDIRTMAVDDLIDKHVGYSEVHLPAVWCGAALQYAVETGASKIETVDKVETHVRQRTAEYIGYLRRAFREVAQNRNGYLPKYHTVSFRPGLVGWAKRLLWGDPAEGRPRVGVGVVVLKDGRFLLGRRVGSHCSGQVSLPGGHLEFGETLAGCAEREVYEETGLTVAIRPYDFLRQEWYVVNNLLPVGHKTRHYTGVFMVADWVSGEPVAKEPRKNQDWHWATKEEMVEHLKPEDAWLPTELFRLLTNRGLI